MDEIFYNNMKYDYNNQVLLEAESRTPGFDKLLDDLKNDGQGSELYKELKSFFNDTNSSYNTSEIANNSKILPNTEISIQNAKDIEMFSQETQQKLVSLSDIFKK